MAGLRNNLREKLPARGATPVCKGVKAAISESLSVGAIWAQLVIGFIRLFGTTYLIKDLTHTH